MTPPVQPQKPVDRARALADGFTPEDIDAENARRGFGVPTRPRANSFASESTVSEATRPKVVTGQPNDWPELVREVGRGATFGVSDKAEAGLRALGSETYEGVREQQRTNRKGFQDRNPVTAAVANAAGGIATGGLLPVLKVGSGLTAGSRIATGGVNAGLQGGAAGFLSADGDLANHTKAGVTGALVGGATGSVLSGAAELLRAGGKAAGGVRAAMRTSKGQAPVIDDQEAAKEALATMQRQGVSLDELRARDATGDAPHMVGELIDGEHGSGATNTLGAANRYGLNPKVRETLNERARGEAGRARRALESNGVTRQNIKALEAEKLAEAQNAAGPLYDEAFNGRSITDPRLLDLVERPSGGKAYNEARTHMLDRGEDMPDLSGMVAKSKPRDLPEVVRASNKDAPPSLDELATMNKDQLRQMRSTKPPAKMTDRELAIENHYLDLLHSEDQAASGFRDLPVYAEREAMSSARMLEDKQGVLSEHGFHDPEDYRAQNFDAGAAERRAKQRAPRMASVKSELEARGINTAPTPTASRAEHSVPEGGELPTIPAKQVQRVKLALDDRLKDLEGKSGGTSTQRYRDLIQLRDEFDNLLYEHAPGYDKAQTAYAKPMQEKDAFLEGRRASSTMDETDVERLLASKSPEYVAKGVGSGIHRDLSRLNDGTKTSSIRNPSAILVGNERARARLDVATLRDPAKIDNITKAAQNIDRRFQTSARVLGGSNTADKLAGDAQELAPKFLESLFSGNLKSAGKAGVTAVGKASRGAQLDRKARIFLAGGGGDNLTRAEAIDLLEAARPLLMKANRTQSRITSGLAGQVGGAAGRAMTTP